MEVAVRDRRARMDAGDATGGDVTQVRSSQRDLSGVCRGALHAVFATMDNASGRCIRSTLSSEAAHEKT